MGLSFRSYFKYMSSITPWKTIGAAQIANILQEEGEASKLSFNYDVNHILREGSDIEPKVEYVRFGMKYKVNISLRAYLDAMHCLAKGNTPKPEFPVVHELAYIVDDWLTTSGKTKVTIAEVLQDCVGLKKASLLNNNNTQTIASILRQLGWVSRRTSKQRYWEKPTPSYVILESDGTPSTERCHSQQEAIFLEAYETSSSTEEALDKEVSGLSVENDISAVTPPLETPESLVEAITADDTPLVEEMTPEPSPVPEPQEENVSPAPVEEEENIDPDYWMLPENKPRFYKMPGEFRVRVWDESDRRDAEKKALETAKKKYLAKALPVEEEFVDEDEEEEALDRPRIPGNNKTVYDPFYGQRFYVEGGEDY